MGVYIHNLKDRNSETDWKGTNPFDKLVFSSNNRHLSDYYYTYDWVNDDGYHNFSDWVELADKNAGR